MKSKRKKHNQIVPFDYFLKEIAAEQSKEKIHYRHIDNLRQKLAVANYPQEKMEFIRRALDELDKKAYFPALKPKPSMSVYLIYHRNG